jgi:hypothetical protein
MAGGPPDGNSGVSPAVASGRRSRHKEGTVSDPQQVTSQVQDAEQEARRARFGRLPEPIRLEDTVQELPATTPDGVRDAYNDDEWLIRNAF